MVIGKRVSSQLERIKNNVKQSYDYFLPNYQRYHDFRRFVFESSLSKQDIDVLNEQLKPPLQFNVLEAYISRLRGEFAKQEPSISVHAEDGAQVNSATLQLVEDYFRAILFEANNNSFEYDVYTDLLSGGFSVMKVWTEYQNEMSFDQSIRVGRAKDPTLCGFDVLAQFPHKGDGNYSYELFPKRADEVEDEFNIKVQDLKFTRDFEGFSWSYNNNNEDIVLLADYYEKKKKKAKIVQLATGQILTEDDYEKFLERWNSLGTIAVPPTVGRSRISEITTICRYRAIENQVIDYQETDYKYLPHIFVDGNSITIKKGEDGAVQQMTRPYVYQARDTQRFMNYAGQCWANELENMVQHKWIVPLEVIPEQYKDAYTNNQVPSVVIYKSLNDENPEQPLPPPREVQRPPMPPEIQGAFAGGVQTVQNILGAYDAALGVNGNDVSGKAIVAGSTNSNASSMPYVVGFLQGLNQAAQCIVDLIPKVHTAPRSIPVVTPEGKKDFVKINSPGAPQLRYDSNVMQVRVEAGVNFAVQKQQSLQMIIEMSRAEPIFGEFINTMGLEVILDNMEIRGIDQLKEQAKIFMQKKQQQQQAAMQQPNPQVIKAQSDQQKMQLEQQKLAQSTQQDQIGAQLKAAEIASKERSNDIAEAKLQAQLEQTQLESAVKIDAHQTEKYKTAIDAALQVADQQHRHAKESVDVAHKGIELAHNIKTAHQKSTHK